jgi:hypothetical protein
MLASMMHIFRACPFPTVGSSAACRGSILQDPEGQNSLVAGKNAGNFADSAVFRENTSQKHLRIQ